MTRACDTRVMDGDLIAERRVARKEYQCADCRGTISLGEPHWAEFQGGCGLGGLKFPTRICDRCLQRRLKGGENAKNKGG
jgi:hypothetical protein